jgi:hypothetical protein
MVNVKENQVTDEEKKRMEYLERVEKAARMACTVFVESDDYDAWDKAMDELEAILKEKV